MVTAAETGAPPAVVPPAATNSSPWQYWTADDLAFRPPISAATIPYEQGAEAAGEDPQGRQERGRADRTPRVRRQVT
ncbi:hypothetical protein GCM10009525_54160 [Streptosporangium amethystogenes subsp. fukuiense]